MMSIQLFLEVLRDTPWWIWGIFIFLIYKGIQSLNSSTGPLYTIFIVPGTFLLLSLHGLWTYQPMFGPVFAVWIACYLFGLFMGWFIFRNTSVQRTGDHITIPGSPLLLCVISIVFVMRYSFAYLAAIHPGIDQALWFIVLKIGISGLLAGIFGGRVFCLWYKHSRL